VTGSLIAVVNAVAMLVVVPLGLSLIPVPGAGRLARWWPLAGGLAAVALTLPRGILAVLLCLPYGLATLVLAGLGAVYARRTWLRLRARPVEPSRSFRSSFLRCSLAVGSIFPVEPPRSFRSSFLRCSLAVGSMREWAIVTALVAPTVAASGLLAERAGYHLFGFDLRTLALTVAHFHTAGFAAALIAGLAAASTQRPAQLASASVPIGLIIVFAGFFTTEWVGVAGTAVLTAGMWLIAWTTLLRRRAARDALTRTLLVVSGVIPLLTMVLALDWALGRAAGVAHLDLTWMAATHGVANLLGFAVCGLLAWRRLSTQD
jgi:hypothetical protein